METIDADTTRNGRHEPPTSITVGEAIEAYMILDDLDPKALGRELTNEVVDAADALESVVRRYQKKIRKHRQRLATRETEEGLELDEAAQEELDAVVEDLQEQEADVDVPTIDVLCAASTRAVRELRNVDALKPILQ